MSREEALNKIAKRVDRLCQHIDISNHIHIAELLGGLCNDMNDIYDDFEKKKAIMVKKPKFLVSDMFCEYPNVNHNAFMEWMAYKKYKNRGAVTKTLNMLSRHSFEVQQEMVDNSIRNEYKGLFEPKVQRSRTDNNVGVAMDWLNENDVFECEVIEHVE